MTAVSNGAFGGPLLGLFLLGLFTSRATATGATVAGGGAVIQTPVTPLSTSCAPSTTNERWRRATTAMVGAVASREGEGCLKYSNGSLARRRGLSTIY